MNLTPEQKAIIESSGNIAINAVAGSGKTTTLIAYARARPDSRILYLAFNRSVKTEAEKKFSEPGLQHVQVETAHSLAFSYVMRGAGYTLKQGSYQPVDIAEALDIKGFDHSHTAHILASHVGRFFSYFCNSNKSKVQELDYESVVADADARKFVALQKTRLLELTRKFLAKMDKGEIPMAHDLYLKKFQLMRPVLPYDFILFDEGQDASEAMLDIFLAQPATKVIVGDSHQQIYSWRYAINAMEKINFPVFNLTTSFRFSNEIASLAVRILQWKSLLGPAKQPLINGYGTSSAVKSKAVIARTNTSLLVHAVTMLVERKEIKKLYFEGRFETYTYADEGASIYDIMNLYLDKNAMIKDPMLKAMNGVGDLEDYIRKTEDNQMGLLLEVVKKYGNKLPYYIKQIKDNHIETDDKDKADYIFSTVHRCKGMEYDEVTLANDFITEKKLKSRVEEKEPDAMTLQKINEEINLLYVAVTRTRNRLNIPEELMPASGINVLAAVATPAYTPPEPTHKKPWNKHNTPANKPSAYKPWTTDDDEMLTNLLQMEYGTKEIAAKLGRTYGAIEARIKRLQLRDEF